MKTVNFEISEKIDDIKTRLSCTTVSQKMPLNEKLTELQAQIEEGDIMCFQMDAFDTLKLLIKAKRELKKSASDSEEINLVVSMINDLRDLMEESDKVINGILRAEGLISIIHIWFPQILIALVITSAFLYFQH